MTQKKTRSRKQPVKNGLKGFAEAKKSNSNLMREINQFVVAEGNRNADVGRESHKIHVSDVIKDDACARQMFYKITKVDPTDSPAGAYHRLEIIWASGHDAHHKWQKWLWGMGELWGTFSCRLCEHSWQATSPTRCANCGEDKEFLQYDEVEFEDGHYHLVGHADGAVPSKSTLVEIKSFSVGTVRVENPGLVAEHTHKVDGKTVVDTEAIWAAIKRPLPKHRTQGLFYLWLCKRAGLPYDSITFIYENKTTQATKTFTLNLTERFLQPYIEVMDRVVAAVDSQNVPDRPTLFTKDARPCNTCIYRSHCWAEEENGGAKEADQESPKISVGRSRSGSTEASGAAEVSTTSTPGRRYSRDPRRRDTAGRSGTNLDDDPVHEVGRAPRRTTGAGGSRREVVRSVDGQRKGSRFSRGREGRDGA